jgi:hypothetical protein
MHLLVLLAVELDVDHHRLEQARDRRRGAQDLVEELQGLGLAAGRQRADVPDHRPLGVEVGGADQEQAAFVVFAADGGEHLGVGVLGDDLGQRCGIGHGVVEQRGTQPACTEDPVGGERRIDLA